MLLFYFYMFFVKNTSPRVCIDSRDWVDGTTFSGVLNKVMKYEKNAPRKSPWRCSRDLDFYHEYIWFNFVGYCKSETDSFSIRPDFM